MWIWVEAVPRIFCNFRGKGKSLGVRYNQIQNIVGDCAKLGEDSFVKAEIPKLIARCCESLVRNKADDQNCRRYQENGFHYPIKPGHSRLLIAASDQQALNQQNEDR